MLTNNNVIIHCSLWWQIYHKCSMLIIRETESAGQVGTLSQFSQ